MKVETRGKYPGVKIHLDPQECETLMGLIKAIEVAVPVSPPPSFLVIVPSLRLARRMGQHIQELLAEQPDLLKERTPEQVAAILAKDHEKTGIQLNRLKNGKDWKKIEPATLKKALMHHVKA